MLTGGDPYPPALAQPPVVDDRTAERRALAIVWLGVAVSMVAASLFVAEVAVIPFQVSQAVSAADSFGNFWPLLGVLTLAALGAFIAFAGRRARRTARRRREWLPSLRR